MTTNNSDQKVCVHMNNGIDIFLSSQYRVFIGSKIRHTGIKREPAMKNYIVFISHQYDLMHDLSRLSTEVLHHNYGKNI